MYTKKRESMHHFLIPDSRAPIEGLIGISRIGRKYHVAPVKSVAVVCMYVYGFDE